MSNLALYNAAEWNADSAVVPPPPTAAKSYYLTLLGDEAMSVVIQQSSATAARRRLYFHAVDATDSITPETGLTGTGWVSKNGGAAAASSGSIVEIDAGNRPGAYYVELTAGEVDTLGTVEFAYKAAACAWAIARAQVVAYDPHAAGASTGDIADAVYDEALAGHATAGTGGAALTSLLAYVDELEARLTATRAGYLDNLSAGAVATQASVNTIDDFLDTEIADIRSRLPAALVGGKMDAVADVALSAAEREAVADALLARNSAGGSNGGITVADRLTGQLAKFVITWTSATAGTALQYEADGSTLLKTYSVTRDATSKQILSIVPDA